MGVFDEAIELSCKWDDFANAVNNKSIINKKAMALANVLTSLVASSVKEMQQGILKESGVQTNDSHWWSVYYDFLLYMMHITDREAAIYLDDSLRHVFMKQLFGRIADIGAEDFDDKSRAREFRHNLSNNFNLFQSEYSSYKRGHTERIDENVSYMFAKRVQKRLGQEGDIILTMQIFEFVLKIELLPNIPALLDDSS